MGWTQCVVVALSYGQKPVEKLALAMAQRYQAPTHQRFTQRQAFADFRDAFDGCLSGCDFGTKLIVCAHGDSRSVGGASADDLAHWLKQCGLAQVGLIAFKACNVGRKQFLHELAAELGKRQIAFGYLVAYKEGAWLAGKGRMRGFWGIDGVSTRVVRGTGHVQVPGDRFLKLDARADDAI